MADDNRLSTMLEKHVAQLLEHVDAVQIFVSKINDDGSGDTHALAKGGGNWHARTGHIRTWLIRVEAAERADAEDEQRSQAGEDGSG